MALSALVLPKFYSIPRKQATGRIQIVLNIVAISMDESCGAPLDFHAIAELF